MATILLWSASRHGYCVRVLAAQHVVEEYTAGNCRGDSQVFLSPDEPGAIEEEELRRYAEETANQMAQQYGVAVVEEDPDLSVL